MDTDGIVIRIKTPVGDMDSPVDYPFLLNFNDLLVAIREVMPEATVTAFEYEDEVGDRITVRSDEELKAMLSYYCNTMTEQRINGLLPDPLQIFPRAGKTPGIRNIHGLKVNTRPSPANDCAQTVPNAAANNSLKKSSAELKRILSNGQINGQDIEYQEQLGHGNGGTVYKANHLSYKRVLAVKVIPLDITVELQKQIMSELEILYKCDSPYIITFFGAFFVENRISICTEFMDGGSLDVYKRIPEYVLGRIAVALALGMFPYPQPLQLLQCIVDEDPPVLPVGQFSETFVHFVTQCMKRQPKERPAPNNLMEHPFIAQHNDGSAEVVSQWVSHSLEERRRLQV
uniref:Mitogen-activated protein kinase kinase 5 n=1 Tax=Neogobius melanostomus TaxID=47308 RepID=A0A8C6USC0_9GOBI